MVLLCFLFVIIELSVSALLYDKQSVDKNDKYLVMKVLKIQ